MLCVFTSFLVATTALAAPRQGGAGETREPARTHAVVAVVRAWEHGLTP